MRNVLIFILLLIFLVGCQTTPKVKEEPKEAEKMKSIVNNISWGNPTGNIICGISFPKKEYKIREEIVGKLYIKNISNSDIKIDTPVFQLNLIHIVKGPKEGNYLYKGPKRHFTDHKTYINLTNNQTYEIDIWINNFLVQDFENKESILPGNYSILSVYNNIKTGTFEINISK